MKEMATNNNPRAALTEESESTRLIIKAYIDPEHNWDKESSYICCCIPSDWVLVEGASKPMNSSMSTVILLLNNMIGSGILAQAYVFMSTGIALASFEYALFGIIVFLGVHLLVKSAIQLQMFDYGEVADACLGPRGELVVDLSIFIGSVGGIAAYIIIIGTLANNIAAEINGTNPWYLRSSYLSFAVISLFVIPLCLIRKFGHLAVISYASIGAVTSVMLLVVLFGVGQGQEDINTDTLTWVSATGFLNTMGTVIFAFGYINAVFHALTTMRNPDSDRFAYICALTTYLGVCMCYVTGLVGYYCFRSSTNSDILENFSGVVGTTFKIIIILHLVLYIPGDFVIMRHSLFKLMGAEAETTSDKLYIVSTTTLLILITMLANTINHYSASGLALTLELTGGISGSILNFVLPGLFAMVSLKNTNDYYIGLFLVLFGACVMVTVITMSFT
jgi:amino acid permease